MSAEMGSVEIARIYGVISVRLFTFLADRQGYRYYCGEGEPNYEG